MHSCVYNGNVKLPRDFIKSDLIRSTLPLHSTQLNSYMWQSWVEMKHYFDAYFKHVTVFLCKTSV